jgi:hypothetical protein
MGKRQRAGAVQDAIATERASGIPVGFGLRQPSGALSRRRKPEPITIRQIRHYRKKRFSAIFAFFRGHWSAASLQRRQGKQKSTPVSRRASLKEKSDYFFAPS